jgi:hypothetical protein
MKQVVVYARTRWSGTVGSLGLGVYWLVHCHLRGKGVFVAALAVFAVVALQRMRLSADASGVTVVNLLWPRRIPWSEISDFRLGRAALSTCLDVCRLDGVRVHAWVLTTTGRAAYSGASVDTIVSDLRQRLMLANGESQADLDARAIDDALAAADGGTFRQASTLVAENRVDAREMAEKLIERAARRRQNAAAD